MLYLKPPFRVINGVSVFGDHEDELQYYYMPLYPKLSAMNDANGIEIPKIQLIKYRGEAGSGGFINFDVNLGLEQEELEEIEQKIKTLNELDELPRLAPIPLLDGTVKLIMLGKDSANQPNEDSNLEEGTDNKPKFVVKISHSAKPSLYGSNQASFSVELDDSGVVVVEEAMQGDMAPIGVVYSLDYMALRDSYNVKVSADWDRVQHHFEESFGTENPIFSASIDEVVDELVEDRVIDIQVDKLFVSDETTDAVEARMDQAVNQIKDMVLDNFFEPSLDPVPTEKTTGDWIADAGRVSRMIGSGGASEAKLFRYKKVDITRVDKKKINVNMSERNAIVKSIYPQGHLAGLFSKLQQPGIEISRFVIPVELDDDWFRKRTLRVISRTDFDNEPVQSVNVTMDYAGDKKNVILDKDHPEALVSWLSHIENNAMIREITYQYDVHFNGADGVEQPERLTSSQLSTSTENLEIRSSDLYDSIPVSIMALDFPWSLYSAIEVNIKYVDEGNNIDISETFLLNETKKETLWEMFCMNPDMRNFNYQLTFRAKNHHDISLPWEATDLEQITIRDPFPNKRKIVFVPAVNWEEVTNIFLDVAYEDEANDIRETETLTFTNAEKDKDPKEMVIKQFKNPKLRIVTYKVTFLMADGTIKEIPKAQTMAERVFLTPSMAAHRVVEINHSEIPFEQQSIKNVEISLRFNDSNGNSFNDKFSYSSTDDPLRYFEYDYSQPNQFTYEYSAEVFFENGLSKHIDWQSTKESNLVLNLN